MPMPMPARTALVAVAALAAVAFAAVRSSNAHTTVVLERGPPQREVTAAQAAATLARLSPPPGFRQVACRFHERYQKCVWTPRALPIDAQTIRYLAAVEHAKLFDALLTQCFRPHRLRGGLLLRTCS